MTKKLDIGPLSRDGRGAHFKVERVAFDIPQRLVNSSSRQPYVPPSWPVRPGADDHKQHATKGIDA